MFPNLFEVFEINSVTDNNSNNSNNNSIYCNKNVINNNSYEIIEIVLGKIKDIIIINNINDNEDFISNILNIIPRLEDLIIYYTNNNNNWRIIKLITFILCFDNIYKLSQNLDNYVNKLFNISKKLLTNECFEIKIDAVKIMAKICKSRIIWDEVIKFVEVEILTNKNFYIRRLYFYFFKELTSNFSFKFLNDKRQIDELMKLINDNNQILPKFLILIKNIFPFVEDDKIKLS